MEDDIAAFRQLKANQFCTVLLLCLSVNTIFSQLVYYFPDSVLFSFVRLAMVCVFDMVSIVILLMFFPKNSSGVGGWIFICTLLILLLYTILIPILPSYQNFVKDYFQAIFWVLCLSGSYAVAYTRPQCLGKFVKLLPWLLAIHLVLVLIFYDFSVQISHDQEKEGIEVISTMFFVVLLLPGCLMLKNGIRKNIVLFILMSSGLIGMKRSLLIVSVLSIVGYSLWRPSSQKKRVLRNILICISLLVVITGVFCYSTYGAQAMARLEAMVEDGGSGRIEIYEDLLAEIETNTEKEWMIGHGPNAVQQYFSSIFGAMFRSAHNDFLEMIYDYGILGFALYVLLHLLLLVYCIKLKRRHSEYFAPFFSAWVFFLVLSLVSHIIIYPSYPAYILIVMGMIVAADQRKYSLFQNKFLESGSDLLAEQPEEDWKKGNIG